MKIVRLSAENFMKLVAVEIIPAELEDKNTILVTGPNGAGKSSVLDVITSALGGKDAVPDKPIRDGEDHGEIEIETESYVIKRTFTEAGGGTLTVTNSDGFKAASPQALLDKIVGEIAFDPTKFINDDARGQRNILMGMVGLDFSDIDARIAGVKSKRSEVRSAKETYEHEAKQITVAEDTPDNEVSVVELTGKLTRAAEHNTARSKMEYDIKSIANDIENFGGACEQMDSLTKRLKNQLAEDKQWYADARNQLDKQFAEKKERVNNQIAEANEKRESSAKLQNNYLSKKSKIEADLKVAGLDIDTEAIQQEIADIESTNASVRQNKQKAELKEKSRQKSAEFSRLGNEMKVIEGEKADRLSKVKMPIKGLSVDENGVTFGKIPFAQVNDAKQLEISVAVGMALNPTLKVIRMKGNDLDSTSLAAVSKMVKDNDYQAWIEKVDETGKIGIVIEDGSVKKEGK